MKHIVLLLITIFFNFKSSFAVAYSDTTRINQYRLTNTINDDKKYKIPVYGLQVLATHVQAISLIGLLIKGIPSYFLFYVIGISTVLAFIFYFLSWIVYKKNPKKKRMSMLLGQISGLLGALSLLFFVKHFL